MTLREIARAAHMEATRGWTKRKDDTHLLDAQADAVAVAVAGELLAQLNDRLTAKLTPSLNTGSAMDMLILVSSVFREARADLLPRESLTQRVIAEVDAAVEQEFRESPRPPQDEKEDGAELIGQPIPDMAGTEPRPNISKDRLRILVASALKSFRDAHGDSIAGGEFSSAVKRIAGALYTELNGYGNETTAQGVKQESACEDRAQAAASETARHEADRPETLIARCLDCGLDYSEFGLDVLLPRWQWLEIHPDENGLLCGRCIAVRAARICGAVAIHATIGVSAVGRASVSANSAATRQMSPAQEDSSNSVPEAPR